MKLIKKHGFKIIVAFIAVILVASNIPWGRTFYKTVLILPEFMPNSPVKPGNFLTKEPIIQEVQYESFGRTINADLWLPATRGKHPAAVLHLGVDIDRKDERIQRLANAFARSGVATLVPNIPSLERRRVLAEGKDDLISSFEYLRSQAQIKKDKVGFIGFCASGGMVLLAAEDPKIADQIAFAVVINPYFDLTSLYENITLRRTEENGQELPWKPSFKTVEIYNRETVSLLDNELDLEILKNYLVKISPEDLVRGRYQTLTEKDQSRLSEEAKFTYDLLTNKDPQKTSYYQENTTAAQKTFVRELSPKTQIDKLKAKTFILMDKNNIYIPYTEAKMLSEALEGKDHLFVKTKILPEGDLVGSLPPKDYFFEGIKIFRFVYSILLEVS